MAVAAEAGVQRTNKSISDMALSLSLSSRTDRGVHCNIQWLASNLCGSPFGGSGVEPGGGKPLHLERDMRG